MKDNAMVVIISQYTNVSINTLYTLKLHNVICQLYLSKSGEKTVSVCQYMNGIRAYIHSGILLDLQERRK